MTQTPGASPWLSLWFGNFFEPFYSDLAAVEAGLQDVADLGFTSVNLDSKPWEDFFARYRGEPASQYVATQEHMIERARELGLDHTCLALYLCGDNLYPTIRDVPPVRGEGAVLPDGSPMGTYKYWSPRAQQSMVEHVEGLLRLYGPGMRRTNDGRVRIQTMFDPIPKPSFDAEGRQHYLAWLERRYAGDVGALAGRYGIDATAFDALEPEQYWLGPERLNWVGCALPTSEDLVRRTPDFHRWVDNQTYLAQVGVTYFADMAQRWRALETPIFVEPVMHQWGYFFNPPGVQDWQTGQRALDVYRNGQHVDGVLYMTAPLSPEDRADALVVSAEAAIQRGASGERPFTGGLYLGRHVNNDVYAVVPPAEAVATLVAAGASDLHAYGYSGLDDGGVMFRMDGLFKDSLRDGLRWAREVLPLLQDAPRRSREVAMLFPAQMSLLEPLELDEGGRHRMDLLGWYHQLVDLGWHVDVLHPDQVAAGDLAGYAHLVVPTDSLEDLTDAAEAAALDTAVRAFVEAGGTLLHGPGSLLAQRAFGVVEHPEHFDCFAWSGEDVIPHGWSTVSYSSGEASATYLETGRAALSVLRAGRGEVHSFGYQHGYSYSRSSMPIVPPRYGRREMHPVVLLPRTPVEQAIGRAPSPLPQHKGLETARFGDRDVVVVNHRSSPVYLSDFGGRAVERRVDLVPSAPGWVAAHSATYLQLA